MIPFKSIALSFMIIIVSFNTQAGTACGKQEVPPQMYIKASQTALEANRRLNKLNPKVALIARVGTDLRRYGLHYSHIAFVVKDYPGKPGKWTVIHLLNECNTNHSSIYLQGLMNFFLDDLYTYDYQITLPNEVIQEKLYQELQRKTLNRLHDRNYNMIAYPYSSRYQNSNQWVLEVIASVLNTKSPVTRISAQKYLLKTGYKPSVIRIDPLSKIGSALFNAHVRFDDHPLEEQSRGLYSTVSVISVTDYLKRQTK